MLCLAYCPTCASVLVEARVADVRHADRRQGPFPRGPGAIPGTAGWHVCEAARVWAALRNGDACSLSCKRQHGKLKSWVREWRVPGCSGQHRFNLDLMCSKDRVGIYICVCAPTALTILLAETSRTHLSPQQSCEAVLSSCEIIPARLPKWKIQKLNSCLSSHSSVL